MYFTKSPFTLTERKTEIAKKSLTLAMLSISAGVIVVNQWNRQGIARTAIQYLNIDNLPCEEKLIGGECTKTLARDDAIHDYPTASEIDPRYATVYTGRWLRFNYGYGWVPDIVTNRLIMRWWQRRQKSSFRVNVSLFHTISFLSVKPDKTKRLP